MNYFPMSSMIDRCTKEGKENTEQEILIYSFIKNGFKLF